MRITNQGCIFFSMESIGKRIARAREKKGLNQSELARQLNLTPQSIQKWEACETVPRGQRMKELARVLGVTIGYLMDAEGDEPPATPGPTLTLVDRPTQKTVEIPHLDVLGSMGCGIMQPEHYTEVIERMVVSAEWVRNRLNATSADNLAIITGRGDSMEGTFSDGDLLLVDRGVIEIGADAMYVIAIDGDLFIKRIQRQPGGALKMISDNPRYAPIDITPSAVTCFQVIGRILLIWGERRL